MAAGSVIRHFGPSHLREMWMTVPPPRVQSAIGEVAIALDSKIELNRRLAETLEATARALFKSWFVDFDPVHAHSEGRPTGLPDNLAALFPDSLNCEGMPPGWTAIGDDVGQVVRVSVEPKDIEPRTPYVGLEHLERGSLVIRQHGFACDINSLKNAFKAGDLLFGKLRPYFNKLAIADFDGICSSDILVFRAVKEIPTSFLYLCFSQPSFVAAASNASSGTRMPRADWAYMRKLPVALPSPELRNAFHTSVIPLLDKMLFSAKQCCALADLRDTLLPKLISGELRIADAEQCVAAA